MLKSYLSEREQNVNIDGATMEYSTVCYGVPQVTMLFTNYINSLLQIKTKGFILSFADDTAILYRSNSWHELKVVVMNDFLKIVRWFMFNKLTLNFNKTK